jgi:predicted transcriptional regulator
MNTATDLVVEVKARVPRKLKGKIERMAKKRMLSTSDIVREALIAFCSNDEKAA